VKPYMELRYSGNELDLFAQAERWKSYWSSAIRKYISGTVLDVGGGIGANIPFLLNADVSSLTILEPDPELFARLKTESRRYRRSTPLILQNGALESAPGPMLYTTILYLDVLEHIADDRGELERAARFLAPSGYLIALVPAYQCLYTPFDEAIGHYRRYSRSSLAALSPPGCSLIVLKSLDIVGLLASFGNAVLLRQSTPSLRQIRFWDRVFVPLSRYLDPVTRFRIGKSILAVWQRESRT
jgi:SAM-dependent methyltransferase